MNADNSSLTNHVAAVLNVDTASAATSNYNQGVAMSLGVNPVAHQYEVCGANGQASNTIAAAGYGPFQGEQSNPCGKIDAVIPANRLQIEWQIFEQAASLRQTNTVGNMYFGTLWL